MTISLTQILSNINIRHTIPSATAVTSFSAPVANVEKRALFGLRTIKC